MRLVLSFLVATGVLLAGTGVYYFASWLFDDDVRGILVYCVLFFLAWIVAYDCIEIGDTE